MKLSPEQQLLLLELADVTRKQALGAVDKPLPEVEEHERLVAELAQMREAAGSAQMAVDDMENEILRIQEDESKLKRRERDDREQLGATTDPEHRKDLEHDRYVVKSRIADLMYELKEAHNEIAALRNNRDVHGARVDELARQVEIAERAAVAAKEAAAADGETPEQRIATLRDALPAEVVALFDERLEETEVGAAAFNGRTCAGCFIVLPPADRQRISAAPANEVPECPNCSCFLIRTQGAA